MQKQVGEQGGLLSLEPYTKYFDVDSRLVSVRVSASCILTDLVLLGSGPRQSLAHAVSCE